MKEILEKVKKLDLLFIAGAPRSGTTLLLNQFDSHPEFACFPLEHKTIEKYFWNVDGIETYAKGDFINKKGEGQQVILANEDYISQYAERMMKIYGKIFTLDIDTVAFKKNYLYYLEEEGVSLNNMFHALGYALICSNDFTRSKYTTLKYLVFKQPFYTELFAVEVFRLIPNSKFIHVIRDPLSRYISAKTRRLKESPSNKLNHINRLNYIEGHAIVDISTRVLARDNTKAMGINNYITFSFDEMVSNMEVSFKTIFKKLKVQEVESFKKPTRLGELAMAGSVMAKAKSGEIDHTSKDRNLHYLKGTTWNERKVHAYYLNKSKLFKEKYQSSIFLPIIYLIPCKNSTWKNLLFQYFHWYNIVFRRVPNSKKFILKAKAGNLSISGNV